MVQTYTQNEMIKALYHELSADHLVELEEHLEESEEIQNNFNSFNVICMKLNNLLREPSDDVVARIIDYSRSYKK